MDQTLIEDVLHGLDINRHAIHLAASMLTLSAPKIDYNKMNLYNMQHGVNADGDVRAGSLDILVDNAGYLPGFAPDSSQRRAAASGYEEETPELAGLCDLVIMNPPFTRNDIRNRNLPPEVRRQVQQHEIRLAEKTPDQAHRNAIDQAAIRTFFTPIADILLRQYGTLAMVVPFTACTSASGKDERNLLTDPSRFHLELVVTSHDNRRIYFSENTDIHESLIVARRPSLGSEQRPTAFVSLAENPASASEAHFLAEAIRQALAGDNSLLANYGTIAWRTLDQLRDRPWNAVCFYDQSLADAYDMLLDNVALAPVDNLASVEPEGRRIRDAFRRAEKRQNPDMRALWDHKSARQTSMRTGPDEFVVVKKGMEKYARHLWQKRSNLLVGNRMRLNLTQTPALFSDEAILGSAFVPVSPLGENKVELCKSLIHKSVTSQNQAGFHRFQVVLHQITSKKGIRLSDIGKKMESIWTYGSDSKAWCVWLNSTFGIIALLNTRQKNLTYPHFSLDGLRSLPVPHPRHCDIAALAETYNQCADDTLRPLPEVHVDPVRHALDDAVLMAVPGLPFNDVARWRQSISLEPSVNNEKEPFGLS